MLISINQLQESEHRYEDNKLTRDSNQKENIDAFLSKTSRNVIESNIIGKKANIIKRKEMLESIGQEPLDFAFERAIGKNDSVYSNFVELIMTSKQKVGRIAIKRGNRNIGFATGFMVSENLLLTNWHVFPTIDYINDSEVQFFYEYDIFGRPIPFITFKFRSDLFFYSNKELDYCFVAVNSRDITEQYNLEEIGYIFLDPNLGKLGNEGEEALNIIHHPDGDYKQLSIRENIFKKITPISIWYEADTAPGSSGSPVFNDQWQVVALHHMGVAKKNASGDYIDKNGDIIPMQNGKVDAAKIVWEANEGIRISVILKDLLSRFGDNAIVKSLKINTNKSITSKKQSNNTQIDNQLKENNMESNNSINNVNISFPASLIEKTGIINISINQGNLGNENNTNKISNKISGELDLEAVKNLEASTDFTNCLGYQSAFLGLDFNIGLPLPKNEIKKFIAKTKGSDGIILKYYNYSTIFHQVRMMPIISAINVDGDIQKRLDTTERKDIWLRDNRLDFDIQLDDKFYANSNFDRGHMSRREDANWGSSAEEAKRNADLTCMYTNACPQVPSINRSNKKGLWGILEKIVLEKGAEAENGKTAKITVFNGPIFKESDPVFKGIQIPMEFYKIVLWLTDNNQLKATAFKLSQKNDVGDIDFEALDIDQNLKFKEYQCGIKSLQKETKIDFSELFKFDTFDNDGHEVAINSAQEVYEHISKNL